MTELERPIKVLVLESSIRNMYFAIVEAVKRVDYLTLYWAENVAQAADAISHYGINFDLVIVDDSSENPMCSSTTLISYLLEQGYKGHIFTSAQDRENVRAHRELGCEFAISKVEIPSSIIYALSLKRNSTLPAFN